MRRARRHRERSGLGARGAALGAGAKDTGLMERVRRGALELVKGQDNKSHVEQHPEGVQPEKWGLRRALSLSTAP